MLGGAINTLIRSVLIASRIASTSAMVLIYFRDRKGERISAKPWLKTRRRKRIRKGRFFKGMPLRARNTKGSRRVISLGVI